jgi:hypothetical protein
MEAVRVSADGRGFELSPSGKRFTPWGFNYDRTGKTLIFEVKSDPDWAAIREDFGEMKGMGANVVRIHLQFARLMKGPAEADERRLAELDRLLALAGEAGLYLDLTGLGCYRKPDVPRWYDEASEKDRWAMQARFWEAVAARCARSPAVFCYNLMNEPVSPGGKAEEWLANPMGDMHYVEVISKDRAGRPRTEISREWMRTLTAAIRRHDPRRLVTVGTFFIFDTPGSLTLGEDPREIAREVDYLSVHMYPKEGKIPESLDLLKSLKVGKPVVIEETFPMNCTPASHRRFLEASREHVAGWIGFYWGKTVGELRGSKERADGLLREWLEFFAEQGPRFRDAAR